MKKFGGILAVLFVIVGIMALGQSWQQPPSEGNRIITYYGERLSTAANDTFWIPDTSSDHGIDLGPFSKFLFEFQVTDKDTFIADSVFVSLYTNWRTDTSYAKDSTTLTYAFDSSANDANWADKKKVFGVGDSTTSALVWDRYVAARVLIRTLGLSGTTYIDSTDTGTVTGTCWGAAGDSMIDFNASGAGLLEADIDEATLDSTDYIYVTGIDSFCVIPAEDLDTPHEAGHIDSLVLWAVVDNDSTLITGDSLKWGLCWGDSALHHYGTFHTDTVVFGLVTSTPQTITQAFAVDPVTGDNWTTAHVDSMFYVFGSHSLDTTAAGNTGVLKILQVGHRVYFNRHQDPLFKWKATWWLWE
jgi:hypothetical protein